MGTDELKAARAMAFAQHELTPAHVMIYAQLLANPVPATVAELIPSLPWPEADISKMMDDLVSLGAVQKIEEEPGVDGRVEYKAGRT